MPPLMHCLGKLDRGYKPIGSYLVLSDGRFVEPIAVYGGNNEPRM